MSTSNGTRALLTAAALAAGSTSAQTIHVTLCSDAHAVGAPPAVGLATAVAQGDHVILDCAAGTRMTVTKPVALSRAVDVDGLSRVTLVQASTDGMFVGGSSAPFTLRNIALETTPAVYGAASTTASIFARGDARLENVSASRLRVAVRLDGTLLEIENSRFDASGGSDLTVFEVGGVRAHASRFLNTGRGFLFATTRLPMELDGVTVSGGAAGSRCTSASRVVVRNSTFSGIDGIAAGRLGGALSSNCPTLIEHTTFANNTAQTGGALYFSTGASPVEIRSSTFSTNRAQGFGGAIAFDANTPSLSLAMLVYLRFFGNEALRGGAVYSVGPSTAAPMRIDMQGVTFKSNRAQTVGGASYTGRAEVIISRGVILENEASSTGAALYFDQPIRPAVISNTIVARNRSSGGGAIDGTDVRLVNATIFDNSTAGLITRGRVEIGNTLVARNAAGNCRTGAGGTVIDAGHNLQYPGASCGASVPVADPVLDSFFVPAEASPALGAADLARCLAPPVAARDVYGQVRPRGTGCAIGAVEGSIERIANARRLSRQQEVHKGGERVAPPVK